MATAQTHRQGAVRYRNGESSRAATFPRAEGAAPARAAGDPDIDEVIALSNLGNAALMRGDVDSYRALLPPTGDFTLLGPFGGMMRIAEMTEERWTAMGRYFRNGTFSSEIIAAYRAADLVVLVTNERNLVEVGGLPAQEWALRVTLVYHREGGQWRMAHRHADPLVARIGEEHAAALARGASEDEHDG